MGKRNGKSSLQAALALLFKAPTLPLCPLQGPALRFCSRQCRLDILQHTEGLDQFSIGPQPKISASYSLSHPKKPAIGGHGKTRRSGGFSGPSIGARELGSGWFLSSENGSLAFWAMSWPLLTLPHHPIPKPQSPSQAEETKIRWQKRHRSAERLDLPFLLTPDLARWIHS